MTPRFLNADGTDHLRRHALKVRKELQQTLPQTNVHVGGFGFDIFDYGQEGDEEDTVGTPESPELPR